MRKVRTWVLLAVLVGLTLLLSGCACKHPEVIVINAVDATCTEVGYSGDVQCTKCEVILDTGDEVPAKGHTLGAPVDTARATCTEDGYTGNLICTVCGKQLGTGVAIAATGHTPGEVEGVAEATCTEDGYTGDMYCTVCGELAVVGETIPATGHTPGEAEGVVEATCTEDGYTGDVSCTVCGELLEKGEVIAAVGHTPGEAEGVVEATCTEDGYTGEISCTVCGELVEEGEAVAAKGHTPSEPTDAVEATCSIEGYTGDVACEVCGESLEKGKAVAAVDHNFGDDHACGFCGWLEPGLYVAEEFTPWAELVEAGVVIVEDGVLKRVEGDCQMGKLVISEDVTSIDSLHNGGIQNDTLTEVWIPKTVTKLSSLLLLKNKTITTLRLFCDTTALPVNGFSASAVEEILLADGTVYGAE